MAIDDFLGRVMPRLASVPSKYSFHSWKVSGKATAEGVGVLPISCDVDKLVAHITDLDSYKGNIEYVMESRRVDASGLPDNAFRFYQRLNIPMLAELQMENVMVDHGEIDGWRALTWELDTAATNRLSTSKGARFDYNDGGWFMRPDAVAYALSSAPRKSDVGRIKFALMTKGADATAPQVVRANIEGMVRWSQR